MYSEHHGVSRLEVPNAHFFYDFWIFVEANLATLCTSTLANVHHHNCIQSEQKVLWNFPPPAIPSFAPPALWSDSFRTLIFLWLVPPLSGEGAEGGRTCDGTSLQHHLSAYHRYCIDGEQWVVAMATRDDAYVYR